MKAKIRRRNVSAGALVDHNSVCPLSFNNKIAADEYVERAVHGLLYAHSRQIRQLADEGVSPDSWIAVTVCLASSVFPEDDPLVEVGDLRTDLIHRPADILDRKVEIPAQVAERAILIPKRTGKISRRLEKKATRDEVFGLIGQV